MLELKLSSRKIKTELPSFVMGICNVTPDSFWEGSRGGADYAFRLIDDGADILDIGGESTRPGSAYVDEEEEIRRVVPVIEAVRRKSNIAISVDTRKLSVMKAAFEAGADILNDVSAMEDAPDLAGFCAEKGLPVILMHKRGTPDSMQKNTGYDDIFQEVNSYLLKRAEFAEKAGISAEKIILDPGIGFGKSREGNISLIRNVDRLGNGKYMRLMALSRKTCIGQITGKDIGERMAGTIAADLISVIKGAEMVRVHDVAETVDSLKVLKEIYL